MSDISTDIKSIISEHLGFTKRPVEDTDLLVGDLGCDSLDTIELVMSIETEFGIEIPDAEVEGFADMTVQQFIEVAVKHGAKAES